MNPSLLLTLLLTGLLLAATGWARFRRQRLLATVRVVTLPLPSRHLGNTRDVQVFLPPGYDAPAAAARRYPVLYVNDGQDAPQLRLRETLARLTARGHIAPLIAVAIPTNENRLQEYGTAVTANAQGLGARAAAYARFVTAELLPAVNSQFRTAMGAEDTAVLGASLGGLSAFDIAWNHLELFGTVGVFSGSFWWRAGADDPHVPPGRLIAHEMVRRGPPRPGLRCWFEAATQDETADRDENGVIDAIQDTLELVDELAAHGCRRGVDVVYHEVRGGRHNYETWSAVLPHFLRWAFPPRA
ncbi:MAG: esterase family protein [Anaerolineales bacterium]|nr:esterase family protein [Anaerolineales bacterium]